MDLDQIKQIKEFYTNKKQVWACTISYYSHRREWGVEYGYDLAPPYTSEELRDYEKRIGFMLPWDLRTYLRFVSREFFAGHYPYCFDLTKKVGKCNIQETRTSFSDEPYSTAGMVLISENGCADNDYLVINGNHLNSIWRTSEDCFHKAGVFCGYGTPVTFMNYIYGPIEEKWYL